MWGTIHASVIISSPKFAKFNETSAPFKKISILCTVINCVYLDPNIHESNGNKSWFIDHERNLFCFQITFNNSSRIHTARSSWGVLPQCMLGYPLGVGLETPSLGVGLETPPGQTSHCLKIPPAMHTGQTPPLGDRILDTHFWKYYLASNFVCGWL